jgi:hypothetical protein
MVTPGSYARKMRSAGIRKRVLMKDALLMLASADTDECIEWPYGKDSKDGRAKISGKYRYCSRMLLAIRLGRDLKPFEYACHKCDNPSCVNPRHIFLGSPRDNVLDMLAKGRENRKKTLEQRNRLRGEGNPRSILTEEDVRAIRLSGDLFVDLGKKYNCSAKHIANIKYRRSWSHIQ